jgi:ABC-type nitrate/sulfonate/bicarbonate transport system permease component
MKGLTYGAASWLMVLLCWSAVTYTGAVNPFFLPKPHEVFQELVPILLGIKRSGWDSSPDFWTNLLITGRRVASSIFLASLLAIPTGMAMGRFPRIRQVTEPITEFFRALPVTILYPVFGFVFGYFDDGSKIAMAVFGSGLVLTVGICEGVKNCDSEIVDAARIDGRLSKMSNFI